MPRRKTPQRRKMPPELTTPIQWRTRLRVPPITEAPTEEERRQLMDREKALNALHATTEAIEKMPLLYQHYGIERYSNGAGELLALHLAMEFVPGFQVRDKPKRGRKDVWHVFLQAALWLDVQQLVAEKKCSERSACNILLKKGCWENALKKGKATESVHTPAQKGSAKLTTLYNRYGESKKSDLVKLTCLLPVERRFEWLSGFLAKVKPFELAFD
jgi:hypothetical protein